jgi:hypothetical protein
LTQPAPRPRVCIERVLPADLFRVHYALPGQTGLRAVLEYRKLWINGSTLHVRFMGGTAAQRAKAQAQALWWTEHANLELRFDDAPSAEIRVAFDPLDGAWSYVGTDARSIPRDQPTMNLGFLDGGTPAHEFGHALGLGHEHQNPAGGIQWNEAAVIEDLSGPPNYWSVEEIRNNVFAKYSADHVRGTAFDASSIMLYAFPPSWTVNGLETRENEVLSATDRAFIGSAQAYPRTAPVVTVPKATPLKIGATPLRARIDVPGEADLFSFQVTSAGPYVVQTGGSQDLVCTLFGPDDPTRWIAEDDDSGYSFNARVTAHLLPGLYYARVRQYSQRAVGDYTMRVQAGAL